MKYKITLVLIIGIMLFLASCSAQEQSKSTQVKVEKTNVIDVNNEFCPVTGEKINNDFASTYIYEGKRYRFCCAGCIAAFKRDPQKYIKIIEEGKYPSGDSQMH